MDDNYIPNKLDTKIKDALNNYQAEFDINDWSKIESKLSRSTSSSFNLKYLYMSLAAIACIGVGIGIYISISNSSTETIPSETESVAAQPIINPTPQPEETPANTKAIDSTNTTTTSENPVIETTTEVNKKADDESALEDDSTSKNSRANSDTKDNNSSSLKKENKKEKQKKETKKEKSIEEHIADENQKPEKVIIMGNEPVFGDMIDSSKGITGKTKESETTKKAAHEKGHVPFGIGSFIPGNDKTKNKQKESKDSIQ